MTSFERIEYRDDDGVWVAWFESEDPAAVDREWRTLTEAVRPRAPLRRVAVEVLTDATAQGDTGRPGASGPNLIR